MAIATEKEVVVVPGQRKLPEPSVHHRPLVLPGGRTPESVDPHGFVSVWGGRAGGHEPPIVGRDNRDLSGRTDVGPAVLTRQAARELWLLDAGQLTGGDVPTRKLLTTTSRQDQRHHGEKARDIFLHLFLVLSFWVFQRDSRG